MIVNKLILHKYRRFALSNIETLTYTPKSDIQLILATNGGGKSSLVRELTPLPSDTKKDYKEGGYKEIHITHNNNNYIISSGLIGKNKHSFEVNGEELNDSGIRKVQLQLVLEHFKVTPAMHEILLGNVMLTNMGVADRKKWLTMISDTDYTYPITVYNKLKSRHRDILGGIKLTQSKLIQSSNNILSDKDVEKAETDLKVLNVVLQSMIQSKEDEVNLDNRDIVSELKIELREAKSVLDKIGNVTDIEQSIIKSRLELEVTNNQIEKYHKDLLEMDKLNDQVSTKDLELKRNKLLKDIERLVKLNKPEFDLNFIVELTSIYKYIYTDFVSLLSNLNDQSDIYYSKEGMSKLRNAIDLIDKKYDIITAKKKPYDTEKEVLVKNMHTNKITCVKCNHSWHYGYDEARHKVVVEEIDKYQTMLSQLEKDREKLTIEYDANVIKKDTIVKLREIVANNAMINPIMRYIVNGSDIQKDTNIILNKANEVSVLLNKLVPYKHLKDELRDTVNLLKSREDSNKVINSLNNLNKDKLNLELSKALEHKQILTTTLTTLKEKAKLLDTLQNRYNKIKALIKENIVRKEKQISKIRNTHLNEAIGQFKSIIATIEKQLYDNSIIKDRVEVANKELKEFKAREESLSILLKELSPTEGLIAKSINSFLNVFIKDINIIINSVWNYDIRLLPCHISEDNDLDYKFPVMIDNNETIDDIALGSSSMKEITNLAFKIVFMKYLGLTNFPLVLDEFAVTMDQEHRVKAFDAIDRLIAPNFAQVFIISHFKSMYGRFERSSDINILNSNNLELDDSLSYNDNLQIMLGK